MSDKSRKQLESDFIYPSLEEVVITQLENIDNKVTNIEPIYFDPNILCCPYCGNTEVIKGGRRKEKQHYICKKCEVKFIDPKQRQKKPNRKFPKRNNDKYFDSDVLCCPSCGSKKFRSVGINRSGKQTYICEETKCSRRFIEPKLRQIRTKIEGVKCRFCSSDDFRKSGIDTRSKKQLYFCLSCKRRFTLNAKIDPMVLPLSEDVWDAQALGLKVIKTSTITKINFTKIHQPWLKELAKNFVKFTSATRALGTISNYVDSIKSFSNFLSEYHPAITEIEQINRNLILEYISHLKSKNLAVNTLRGHIGNFKVFLDTGNQNKWFKTDRYLIIEGDRPKKSKTKPRYIPKYVKQQLNKHLDKLPKPLARMVLVIQECGMRYSSLGTISFDCLEYVRDDPLGNQQWSIKFYDEKLKQDRIIPISLELVEVVKQQQSFIREHCGHDNEYLFTARRIGTNKCEFKPAKNKIMKLTSFCDYLNKLAVSHNIQDENGKLWRFESHQFRHTVGTEMINQGVPQHIIMKILGHCSPEMTMRYAHIHDETLRKELAKFHESKTIDITGQIVALELEGNPEDLEWFTKEIAAIALPNGYCGRPKILGDCDIAGDVGCYICPHFRTNKNFLDIHKDQLERIKKVLTKAYKYDWQLPVKKNEPIRQNLELIITTLEADDNEKK